MKKIALARAVLITVFAPVFAFGDFDDAVEDSRRENQIDRSENRVSSSSGDACSTCADVFCASGLWEVCTDVFLQFWLINTTTRYLPYPYAYDGYKYIVFNTTQNTAYDEDSASDFSRQRFSVGTSFIWLKNLGKGNESHFDCMLYPLIGLYAENLWLTDKDEFSSDAMGAIRLGTQLPLVQTNPFSTYVICEWARWYGDVHDLLRKNGIALGGELKSYPIKPITLRYKFAWQFYGDNVYVFDSNLQIGAMVNRCEIFAAWKYLSVGNTSLGAKANDWHGITAGARLYF